MGFAVRLTGGELIDNLRSDASKLFGRQYPLYIIALATQVDDDALKWLVEYGRAIDSLTNHSAAFITFYNSIRFYVSTGRNYSMFIDKEGMWGGPIFVDTSIA